MLGVQSCKHFGCQRSHPMILGFRHPSGALEDGARGKILVFKQWKWSLCTVESTVLARQTKKLSKFEVRDEFCQQYKMPGGTNFFRGTFLRLTLCWKNLKWKVVPKKAQIWLCAGFYDWPYVESMYSSRKKFVPYFFLELYTVKALRWNKIYGTLWNKIYGT